MVWEGSATLFGVTVVSNNKTVSVLNSGLTATYSHDIEGYSRTSFTGIHVQTSGINSLKFYAISAPGTSIYTTTEGLREQISYNEILWWPLVNRLMVR